MSTLPTWICDIASSAQWQRQTFSDVGFKEDALDEIVSNQRALLADLLVENDLMEGTSLRYIGRQFHDVDLLFAEVDDEDEPQRLVLVENKLVKNPEAKRRVIGQIIEYAARFQEDVRAEALANRFPEHREWIEENGDLLNRQLERGDFLLVICGDSIHANVADIVTRLARRADRHPLSGMQLCLVSMSLYVSGAQRLLVPHVVGLVARAERQLQITVVDSHGSAQKAKATTDVPIPTKSGGAKPDRSEEQFFREAWSRKFGPHVVDDWYQFIGRLREAEIPGLSFFATSSGRPSIQLRSAVLDTVLPVLRARKSVPGIRDLVDSKMWNRNPRILAARDRFRTALRQMADSTQNPTGTVNVPMKSVRSEAPHVISALKQLADELDSA